MHALNEHHHFCTTKTSSTHTHIKEKPNVILHAHRNEHRMSQYVFMKNKHRKENMTPTIIAKKNMIMV